LRNFLKKRGKNMRRLKKGRDGDFITSNWQKNRMLLKLIESVISMDEKITALLDKKEQ
jgi:hypothetical protein